jgi:O-antigen ligase
MRVRLRLCKAIVSHARRSQIRMLASKGMRLASELRSPLLPALVLVGVAFFFAADPGIDPGSSNLTWIGLAAVVLLVVLFATQGLPDGLVVLVPLALLAVWCAATVAWSVEPDRSWDYANRTFVYLVFALIGAYLGRDLKRLLYGFSILLGAVCVWSLAGKVVPGLHESYGRISRLTGPVGYWNALALLGDIALPMGLCLATKLRIPGTLLVYGWIVVIGLTYSRGGVLVAVVVVALWMILSKAWIEALATLLAAGLPAAGALAVAFSLAGITKDGQTHATRVHDGIIFGAVLLADAAIAAGLSRFTLPGTRFVRRLAFAVLAVCVAASVAVGVAKAQTWWRSFTSTTPTEITQSPTRLGEAGSNFRWQWWKQAWQGWKQDPIVGTGAGSFAVTNKRYRTSGLDETVEPHSLPVQFLSETGVVGLVLFGASIVWLVVRGRRRPGPQLALALALPAYFLHGLLDIDWDFLAVSGPVFLIAGALVVRPSSKPRPRAFSVLTVGGLLAILGLSLCAIWLGGHWLGQAQSALGVDDAKAISLAKRARTADPLAADPLLTAGDAQADIAREIANRRGPGWQKLYDAATATALGYYRQATRVQPHDAEAWYELGSLQAALGCPYLALPSFNRATVLDKQNPAYNVGYSTTLAQVNSGTYKC